MATEMRVVTCGDCIHADLCAINPLNTKFSRDHIPEKCMKFTNKNDYVELKHGKWVAITEWSQNLGCLVPIDFECSECGCLGFDHYNYCPSCGARMDGDKNG